MRIRAVIQAVAAVISVMLVAAGVARANAFEDVLANYASSGGTIPACQFSSAELSAAAAETPPDVAEYGTGFVDAVQQALSARAAGGCARSTTTGLPSGSAKPAPPIALGHLTAATGAGVPAVLVILAVVGGALALAVAVGAVARVRGWDPYWAAGARHSFAEAGFRVGGTWAEFVDWLREGRGTRITALVQAPPPTTERVPPRPVPRPRAPRVPIRIDRRAAAAAIVIGAVAVAVIALSTGTGAPARIKAQESIFQDDDHLIYSSTAIVDHTLAVLKGLGADRVRITVKWSLLAPGASSRTRPTFDATSPAAYPAAAWVPYDRIVRLAGARGIGVDFNVTAPGPLWAMRATSNARAADHYVPSPRAFGQFVRALGTRYSGSYAPPPSTAGGAVGPLPRVDYWSVWNEPNQPGWLAPQWRAAASAPVEYSPRLYRYYVNRAVRALLATGHSAATDTILIGELAAAGRHTSGPFTPITPMPFMRALYCVDDSYRPLVGSAAAALGCPAAGNAAAFVTNNPGLFNVTGFAHHPYDLFDPPSVQPPDPDVVTLSTLSRLESGLDRVFAAYGSRRHLPLYLTEYGYKTNPPDPYQVVTPAEQAAYLNQADYIAWLDPRVRSVAQFLLYDAEPDPRYPPTSFKYWDTFQTGLLYANGGRKPAYSAYRLPIWLPVTHVGSGSQVLVWGQLRSAPRGQAESALVQWRPAHGRYRTIATAVVRGAEDYLTIVVTPPGNGYIRIAWRRPTGRKIASRSVAVTVG